MPAVRERLIAQQVVVTGGSPADFRAQIERELKRMRDAATAADIRLE
jgi:hypothetical protein